MKYECDMIRDLMSLCADGMASDASKQAVKAHLEECKICAEEWDLMNQSIKTYPKEPIPEEIKQYHQTAKRLRKHHLIRTTLTFSMASLLAWWIFTNPYSEGVRFTAKQSAVVAFDYNQNGKNLNVIAEPIVLENGNRIFWMTDGEGYFYIANVHRDFHTYGLWMAYAGEKCWYRSSEENSGLYYFEYYSDDAPEKWFLSCYAENLNAESVTLTAFGKTSTKYFNENGLAIFEYPANDSATSEHCTGFARDSAGNIIYELHFDEQKGRYYWLSTT